MGHFTDTFRKLSQEALRLDNYIIVAERAYQDALDHGKRTASGLWNNVVTLKARKEHAQKHAALALAHKYSMDPQAHFIV